ncbi:hypothetical protein HJB77_26380 [Rhizobium lentis]|nr:hypothetical protein [Rhizobium lentis]MBX5179752.1 hypothetical protein [Rhizobium lentis]
MVRGMDILRVEDASIVPTLTSGNTNVPSMMIGGNGSPCNSSFCLCHLHQFHKLLLWHQFLIYHALNLSELRRRRFQSFQLH